MPPAAIIDGNRTLLNLPEDHDGCSLRIENGKDGRMSFHLDLSMPLVGSEDERKVLTIVSQVDVTSVVEHLAVQEYHARRASAKSARSFDLERNDWIDQADIESGPDVASIKHEENAQGPPGPQMRRLLAFVQTMIREHKDCCVFAEQEVPGWDHINWKIRYVSPQMYESGKQLYEHRVDAEVWDSLAHHLDESWEGFHWPQTISWGETGEQRLAYFVPMANGFDIDEEERKKYWLMVLSDCDEDVWRKERTV